MKLNLPIKLLITIILGLFLGYFAAITVLPRLYPTPPSPQIPQSPQKVSRPGKIVVEFETPNASVGQQIKANLLIDTQEKTISGFDIILMLDPQAWKVVNPQVQINPAAPFANYPVNKIDYPEGKIQLSGLSEVGKNFTGKIIIGSLLLKPQKTGNLELKVVFEKPGSGNDSNLAQIGTGQDVLGEVISGEINVL